LNIAHDINPHRANSSERDVSLNVAELGSKNGLYEPLCVSDRSTCNHHCADFWQRNPTFPIHGSFKAFGNTAPQFDGYPIARTQDVVRTSGQIHRQPFQIAGTVYENALTKAVNCLRASSYLFV
jgi:hypothetical protein